MNKRDFTLFNSVTSSAFMLFIAVGVFVTGNAAAQESSESHSAAAVVAADERWSKAEDIGDTDYIDALLLPEYRSISSDGSTHDKATIVAHARKNANTTEGARKAETWQTAHPYLPVVEMNGDVAILTFVLQKGVDPKPVISCDIFVYRDGHWRALYSQHTEAGK
jgi:hypothetical protein